MRILLLTQWFQPEQFFKGLPFAQKLKENGYDVEVLTGFPNYPEGKVYPGYKVRFFQREMMNGIRVNRTPLYPSHDNSGIKRIINYLSFAFSSLLLGPWLVKKPDVIYVYNLITLAWTASFLRAIYGAKIVYDVQDLWPDSVTSSGLLKKNKWVEPLLSKWCLWAYKQADKISVLSPGFKNELNRRGVPGSKIEVVYNWCDEEAIHSEQEDDVFTSQWGLSETFNIVYAGNMGVMQGLGTVLEAARLSRDDYPKIRFVLVGGGVEMDDLKLRAHDMGLSNVVFIPRQPMNTMGRIFALADALLVHLKDNSLFRITIPSKTQVYLSVGVPIVMAVYGDAADLVEEAGAGLICKPENSEELFKTVIRMYQLPEEQRQKMGCSGQYYYETMISQEVGVKRFIHLCSNA